MADSHPIAATVLGLIGTICWCVQLFPQIWQNWRNKTTEGLPGSMFLLWTISGAPFGVYAIVQDFNIPLQVQPQMFMFLCAMTWVQCLHYSPSPLAAHLPDALTAPLHHPPKLATKYPNRGLNTLTTYVLMTLTLVIFGGIEAALILTLRPLFTSGLTYPITIIGIVAAVLLAVGLLPPYWEVWRRKGRVVGINWWFLGIDWCGAFFSLMSLVAQREFDVVGGVQYCVCLALETGLFGLGLLDWGIRRRKGRKGGSDVESVETLGGVEEGEGSVREEKDGGSEKSV